MLEKCAGRLVLKFSKCFVGALEKCQEVSKAGGTVEEVFTGFWGTGEVLGTLKGFWGTGEVLEFYVRISGTGEVQWGTGEVQ